MKKLGLVLCAISAYFAVMTVNAADAVNPNAGVKIGVVDVQTVVQKSPQMATVAAKLKQQFKPREQAIVGKQKQLQADQKKYDKNASVMSSKDRAALQDKIIAEKSTLQGQIAAFQRDITNEQNSAMQNILNQVKTAVKSVAQQGGYTLVLQKQSLAFSTGGVDITKAVLVAMKKQK